MNFIKCMIATLLLIYSGQSLALFMPDGFRISTDTTVESDGGCGVIDVEPGELITQ